MNKLGVMRWGLYLVGWLWLNSAIAQAQMVQLYFPHTPVKTINHGHKATQIQVTDQPFGRVVDYYLKKAQEPEWEVTFPNVQELDIWWRALQQSRKPPVLMLNLVNLKSKVNFNLTVGAVPGTSPDRPQTIITIYESKRVFGQTH